MLTLTSGFKANFSNSILYFKIAQAYFPAYAPSHCISSHINKIRKCQQAPQTQRTMPRRSGAPDWTRYGNSYFARPDVSAHGILVGLAQQTGLGLTYFQARLAP
jgi:hypothetical protein